MWMREGLIWWPSTVSLIWSNREKLVEIRIFWQCHLHWTILHPLYSPIKSLIWRPKWEWVWPLWDGMLTVFSTVYHENIANFPFFMYSVSGRMSSRDIKSESTVFGHELPLQQQQSTMCWVEQQWWNDRGLQRFMQTLHMSFWRNPASLRVISCGMRIYWEEREYRTLKSINMIRRYMSRRLPRLVNGNRDVR